MSEYRSEHTGKVVDDAVTAVTNNNCKIKWGNILSSPSIDNQEDLWNSFLRVEGSNSMTGDLTIKKSSPQVSLNATNMERGVVPLSSDLVTYFRFRDKNNSALGNIGYHQYTDGKTATIIGANSPSGSGSVYISVGYDSLGNPYTHAPTPVSSDNSTNIATTEWVRTAAGSGLGVVHLAGTETITGNKTFSGVTTFTGTANFSNGTATAATRPAGDSTTNVATTKFVHDGYVIKTGDTMTGNLALDKDSPEIFLKNSSMSSQEAPSEVQWSKYSFRDNTNSDFGFVGFRQGTDNSRRTSIACYHPTDSTQSVTIYAGYDANGNGFTYAPTPAANDNTTKIATTAWVTSKVTTNISSILGQIYPVGSIYIGTQKTCPLASLISNSTWVLTSKGRVLQGSNDDHAAGTTIAAGLPNITGQFRRVSDLGDNGASGAFYTGTLYEDAATGSGDDQAQIRFDASRSSSIYSNSTTVQPPAYVVNVWRRTK